MTNLRLIYLFVISLGGFWREPGKEKGKVKFVEGFIGEKGWEERWGNVLHEGRKIDITQNQSQITSKSKK